MTDNYRRYDDAHASKFVAYLGCWKDPAPTLTLPLRDPAEYQRLLRLLIETNKTRLDSVGKAETRAAERALNEEWVRK